VIYLQSSKLKGESLKSKNQVVKFENLKRKVQSFFKSLTNGFGYAII
jgi:hypothetical protein